MFNAPPSSMEGAEKSPGNPALNSFQARRAEFAKANNSAPGTFPKKPASPKPLQIPKPPSDEGKPPIVKPGGLNRVGGSIHGQSQDSNGKPTFPKPPGFKTSDQQNNEPKVPFPKPSGNKLFMPTNSPQEHRFGVKPSVPTESKEDLQKPVFPRPSAVKASENEPKPFTQKKPPFTTKPPVNSVASTGESNATTHGLVAKTFSNSIESKLAKQTAEENPSPGPTTQAFPGVTLRPSGIKQLQSPFLKQNTDELNDRTKQSTPVKDFQAKVNQDAGNSRPPISKYPRIPSTSQMPAPSDNLKEQKDPSEPKRKPLPSPAQLGPPPQKPSRPPVVDLERFRSGKTMGAKVPVSEQRSSALSSSLPPPPPSLKSPAAPSSLPSLPPRNIRSTEDHRPEDGAVVDDISEESDEECYEGIDELNTPYKREQEEKNEKQRKKELEQAKKEQKEREKKEQEIKKKFRLSHIEVIHQAQANTDYKGGKNELSFKKGDQIEIIRVTDNPEGKWLGRMKENYGYIKTAMVVVDYGSLPRKNPIRPVPVKEDNDQDIYDDVGEQDSISNHSIGGNPHFPPPPTDDDDIYDGVDDGPSESSVPQEEEKSSLSIWNRFIKRKGTEIKKKHTHEKTDHEEYEEDDPSLSNSTNDGDVYDDVDTSDFPPPPIEFSLSSYPSAPTPGKSPDYKTLKKLEKEEKEFRKKFKFTGEIRILSTVQVASNLATKKWGSKDLPLKPGEVLSVIQHTNDSTLLCKNNEGKYGYVSRSNIDVNDGDIYDDIGEDCIYDND